MSAESTRLTSRADVTTDAPVRYAKQLAAHLGRKAEVQEETGGTRIVLASGSCLLVARDGVLEMRAEAADAESLQQVEGVVGRHLEKFGARAGLVVVWAR